MKVLITGLTGLVGSTIETLLLEKGHTINYLTTSKLKIRNTTNLKGFYWNPEDIEIDLKCFDDVDAIIHLAGASIAKRWTNEYKKEIINSRALSTKLLYNSLQHKKTNIKHFISASAIGIYPDSLDKLYAEEQLTGNDSFLSEVVQKWELGVDDLKTLNIPVCKIRIGLVLSNKGGALPKILAPIKLGLGSAFGSGKQIQSWIHCTDLARLFVFALENNWTGVYNGVAPHPITNKKLTETCAAILNKPLFIPNMPKLAIQLILGEMHTLLYNSQNVSAKKVISSGFTFNFEYADDALRDLLVK